MSAKLLQVERAWSLHKTANGITARSSQYEALQREMLQKSFPETFSSYRNYEITRFLYNICSKHRLLEDMRSEFGARCDFLNPELSHDTVLACMKEVMGVVTGSLCGGLSPLEMKALLMELLCMCAPWCKSVCLYSPLRTGVCERFRTLFLFCVDRMLARCCARVFVYCQFCLGVVK